MMWHALPGKGGISIEQSKQWRAFCIYKTWALKYHARIGQVKGTIIWVKDWCARLECCVQLAIVLQLRDRSFHGINRISPVKIQNLLSIQLWRAVWGSIRGKSPVGVGNGSLPSANYLLNTSWLPSSIAHLTCLAMVRNEECLISAGLKSSWMHTKVIMYIIDIKHIRNISRNTFVMMLNSFLASSRDAVPCVR